MSTNISTTMSINISTILKNQAISEYRPQKGNTSRGKKWGAKKKNQSQFSSEGIHFKTCSQEYGRIEKSNGCGWQKVYGFDGQTRLGKIRGSMRKNIHLESGDIVLFTYREFEHNTDRCDIVLKYSHEEIRKLQMYGEIPQDIKLTSETNEINEVLFDEYTFEEGKKMARELIFHVRELPPDEDEDEDEENDEYFLSRY